MELKGRQLSVKYNLTNVAVRDGQAWRLLSLRLVLRFLPVLVQAS